MALACCASPRADAQTAAAPIVASATTRLAGVDLGRVSSAASHRLIEQVGERLRAEPAGTPADSGP